MRCYFNHRETLTFAKTVWDCTACGCSSGEWSYDDGDCNIDGSYPTDRVQISANHQNRSEELTNPNNPPPTNDDAASGKIGSTSHPAKIFLVVSGCAYLLLCMCLVMQQVTEHGLSSLSPGGLFLLAAVSVFGILALWLGHRRYSGGGRVLTILWGTSVIMLALFAGVRPPSTALSDLAIIGLIYGLTYLIPAIIIARAIANRPNES